MAKAPAKRPQRKGKNTPKRSSGFGPFVLGLMVGAAGMFLYVGVIQDRPTEVGSGIQSLLDAASRSSDKAQPAKDEQPTVQTIGSSDGFEFNFYDVLLDDEYVLQSTQPAETPAQPAAEPQPATQAEAQTAKASDAFILQAGSFKSFEDADKLKAQIALLGEKSFIQKVSIEGRGDFYRVRLGPFDELKRMKATDSKLADQGIKTVAFKFRREA